MKNVEDLYPLTPMQQAMLLHATVRSDRDTLHNQFEYRLDGALDSAAFRCAWEDVLRLHPALRTAFVWEGLPAPLQVVRESLELPLTSLDWTMHSLDRQAALREEVLHEDRAKGFALGDAPLLRLTLARQGESSWWLLWSSHHLVLDRWCTSVVLEDLWERYAQRLRGGVAPSRVSAARFGQYLQWIQAQDRADAEGYWRRELGWSPERGGIEQAGRSVVEGVSKTMPSAGAPASSSVSAPRPADSPAAGSPPKGRSTAQPLRSADYPLEGSCLQAVRSAARRLQVSSSVFFQGAWALMLQRLTGRSSVVFGATVSGRPADLPGVERSVGSFVSNVPVRVGWGASESVGEWLRRLQRQQQERQAYEYLSTSEIQRCSGLPPGEPLFDSLLVWLAPVRWEMPAGLELVPLSGSLDTPWPLTVSVEDSGERLAIRVQAKAGLHKEVDPARVLAECVRALQDLVQGADAAVQDLTADFETEPGASSLGQGSPGPAGARAAEVGQAAQAGAAGREGEELAMLEQLLLTEVGALLESSSIGLDEHFFEVGGNSLLAAQLHVQIEAVLSRSVPILPLFQAGSLRDMAAFLAAGDWPLRAEMVRPVRAHGSRTPLFCISSPEVNSIGYVLLARHLDPDQPVLLVQSPPSTDEVLRMAISEIPAFAQRYFDALRKAQPRGPYRLLAMCDGALIALEVAKLLTAEGENVEFFGTLNSFSLNTLSQRNRIRRVEVRLGYYAERLSEVKQLSWTEKRTELARVLRERRGSPGGRPRDGEPQPKSAEPQPAGCQAEPQGPTAEAIHREWQDLDWPGKGPAIVPFEGKVTVFRIRRQPYFRRRERALGWQRHARSVEVVELSTAAQDSPKRDRREWRESHLDILREPDVRRTAAAVQACLDALPSEPDPQGKDS